MKMRKKFQDNLQNKYKLKEKGEPTVKEKLMQSIKAKTAKINRTYYLEIIRVNVISK